MKFKIGAPETQTNQLNLIEMIIAPISIFSMIIPIVIVDISLFFYQHIYFNLMGIPKVDRAKYVGIDRWDFSKLNFFQKLSCIYCDYANGIIDWARACARQTELYNCGIKYSHAQKNTEDRERYYDRETFR